jgi:transcriptional regulator with XRE-family HTH domain
MKSFAERLPLLRKSKKITQKQLAEALGINTRTIQYYESGDKRPDFDGLIRLADYFDVSIDYLVGRSDDPRRH